MQDDSKQTNQHIKAVALRQDNFQSSSSEETIYILHTKVTEFEDIHAFWSEAKQIYSDISIYAEDQPRPINQTEFARILEERTYSLTQPLPDFILRREQWVEGMLMTDRWDETLMLVKFGGQYLIFYWYTTA